MTGPPARRFSRFLRLVPALALAALAGCGTLPTITPDMGRVDPESVQFKTASGKILSPERSKEILARLASGDRDPDSLARHLALEQEISGTPLSLGNRVVLLEDGPSTYSAMLAAIASARDHVNMETYILEDDEAGRRFADALLAKQAQGVQVNLIHDGVGSLRTPKEFFKRV
jgi:cardiolipin synthase